MLTTAHTRVDQGIRAKAKVDKRLSGKMVMSTLCPPQPQYIPSLSTSSWSQGPVEDLWYHALKFLDKYRFVTL